MDLIVSGLAEWLPEYGPWLLFALAVLETSFITGLAVPSGVATSLATTLALTGQMDLPAVLVAAFAGGLTGDCIGFWIGHWWGDRLLKGEGRVSRAVAAKHHALGDVFDRHPIYSVTLGRLISFVRTVMPMAAGMSGLKFRTFLVYELFGLTGWVALYVSLAVLAEEGWELATGFAGAGGAVAFVAVVIVALIALRKSRPSARRGRSV
jgi:membrane protein DedA with SNARE-associated domain